jgi:hypothetical protein
MSILGHSLPINSAPVPNNVRYASDSDRILRRSKTTLLPIRVARDVAAGLSRPSKHLIRLAFTMRSSPHNVGLHESRFPSLGISAMNGHRGQMG